MIIRSVYVFAGIFLMVSLGCHDSNSTKATADTDSQAVTDSAKQKAMHAKDALFEKLSGRLTEVIGNDGAAAAIDVCSREATDIAKRLARSKASRLVARRSNFAIPKIRGPLGLKTLLTSGLPNHSSCL